MHETHPDLEDTLSDDATLWRYMDLARFVDLLQTSELHLARVDQMQDKWEGAYGPTNTALRPDIYGEHYATMEDQFPRIASYARTHVFLNCWHIADSESAAMWSVYDREGRGIAVKARKADLLAGLVGDQKVHGFPVEYTDYSVQFISERNLLLPYMHKRLSFQHEQEYRLMVAMLDVQDTPTFLREKVDLSKAFEQVFVSPEAPGWFLKVIRRLVDQYGFGWTVQHSDLASDPIY
ncbi:DUF2971 domain-containing protein [Virgisporangium aurantiacum]|uniref:DUF2971 domain-containing protein n=1 Tax=Virgisporangium aurantiacum TaxID=175570 RepID=A0A8J3ZLT6_9ACTN|nr:DUF2971 domain-containing protein [Virgisporangium aurantiacum]GIJ64365.1 DUF2971 domain-containing protein [Virgisporangium aurantiacum]